MHDDPSRTTPLGMVRYSYEFIEAALAVREKMANLPGYEIVAPIPALYLVGHSIELSLKGYLLHRGISLTDLRNRRRFGHSLDTCFRKTKELGLLEHVQFSVQEDGAFELLDGLYSTKQLEYIVTGAKHFPVLGLVERFAIKLFNPISCIVGFNRQIDDYPT